jgi:hypothetical protein
MLACVWMVGWNGIEWVGSRTSSVWLGVPSKWVDRADPEEATACGGLRAFVVWRNGGAPIVGATELAVYGTEPGSIAGSTHTKNERGVSSRNLLSSFFFRPSTESIPRLLLCCNMECGVGVGGTDGHDLLLRKGKLESGARAGILDDGIRSTQPKLPGGLPQIQ